VENNQGKYEYAGLEPLQNVYRVKCGKKIIYTTKIIEEPVIGTIQSFYAHDRDWILV
jgi:hypothetical protein